MWSHRTVVDLTCRWTAYNEARCSPQPWIIWIPQQHLFYSQQRSVHPFPRPLFVIIMAAHPLSQEPIGHSQAFPKAGRRSFHVDGSGIKNSGKVQDLSDVQLDFIPTLRSVPEKMVY